VATLGAAVGVRLWNALAGPLMWGYDAWGHVAYALFLDLYEAVPWADQGWSYFHPPLHYVIGWALAGLGSGEALVRGLSLVGSLASLGTAALAAWLARAAEPTRPELPLVAFAAVAFLPVQIFMSPMPGNQLTASFLSAVVLVSFIANERRLRPPLSGALLVGLWAALSMLTKFSGLLEVLVVCATLALRCLLRGAWRETRGRAALRAGVVVTVALLLSGPYYVRNWIEFGNPFQLSRDFALVTSVEKDQPPGRRTWRDYVRLPAATFSDPNPLAPHLVSAVWPSVYLNTWADTMRESDVARALEAEREARRSTTWMGVLGLIPTALALLGAGLALADIARGRRRPIYIPLLIESVASLAVFVVFSWRVPIWSALKASYLLGLSLPFAVFIARSVEAGLARSVAWQRAAAPAALAVVFGAAAVVGTDGVVLPRRADAPAAGAVHFYFGETDAARRVYGRLVQGARYPVPWLDNLAAVSLAEGRTGEAYRLLARAVALEKASGRTNRLREGRLAAAAALDGRTEEALDLLGDVLADEWIPELAANRGAIRAASGDLEAAERDLRAVLTEAPMLAPAWRNLAVVLERTDRGREAEAARRRARQEACRPPRGYPYGIGTGEVLEWGILRRPLLLLTESGLTVALPETFRRACP
jgi:Flp pilus assembly protein TadD